MTESTAEKIRTKLEHLHRTLPELQKLRALPREAFMEDRRTQAAAERLLQTSIEAAIDAARLLIIEEGYARPEPGESEFAVLAKRGVLAPDLAERLTAARRFRNVLVHEYIRVDPDKVQAHLQSGLGDLAAFTRVVARSLEEQDAQQ